MTRRPTAETRASFPAPVALCTFALALLATACASASRTSYPQPAVIPHSAWEAHPPLGHSAVANRRNLAPGSAMTLAGLTLELVSVTRAQTGATDTVQLRLKEGGSEDVVTAAEGAAFNWRGYHVAVVSAPAPGELGGGLVAMEVGTLASLPAEVANSQVAGGAELRLRIPHEITHVTLHHTGSAEPLRPEDDPAAKLRGLQTWGASDRNWWDVPYHLLIDLQGRVWQGRDWRYMGETNTTYDPRGHLLISMIGNYERQEPTPAQLNTIADLMAWGVTSFDVPLDRIGGHYDYAETGCPGRYLRGMLEDGTFRRMVEERIARSNR